MFRVTSSSGTTYHADLSELIEDACGDAGTLEDRHDMLCKIVERMLEPYAPVLRKRILVDCLPTTPSQDPSPT